MTVAKASLANLTGGSRKGIPNKTTVIQREAIIEAASEGHKDGLVGYYRQLRALLPDKFADHVKALLPRDIQVSGPGLEAYLDGSWKAEREKQLTNGAES